MGNILPAREARAGRRKESIMGCRWLKGRFNSRVVSVSLQVENVAAVVVVVVGVVCRDGDGERKREGVKRGGRGGERG